MSASSKKKLRKEQANEVMTQRQQQEKSDARKTKIMTISFIAALVLIVGIFVGSLVVNFFKIHGVIEKATIAAKLGDRKLNSITMNYFYKDAIETDYNSANETLSYYQTSIPSLTLQSILGYDPTIELSKQTHPTTQTSWAQYYWDRALSDAQMVYNMYDLAKSNNFQLPAEYASSIDQEMMTHQLYASLYNQDTDAWLRGIYGNGANEKNYREYLEIKALATAYYQNHQATTTFTDAERDAYFNAHPTDFTAYSYNQYTLNYTSYLPKKEVAEGETVTYTAEEEQAARDAAKADAEALKAKTNVTDLDAAIAALSINEGKESKSIFAENTSHSTLSAERQEWFGNADRKAGDTTVFENKTTTGTGDEAKEVINSYTVVMYGSKYVYDNPTGNVRHVLVKFEGGTTDNETGTTTYSAEEKKAAEDKAKAMLAEWEAGDKSEASFIELVKQSADTASVENGGLYENIGKSSGYETNFENWAIDPDRKVGDYEIISTSHGYHIMFYSANGQGKVRDNMINSYLLQEHMTAWETEVADSVKIESGKTNRIDFDLKVSEMFIA